MIVEQKGTETAPPKFHRKHLHWAKWAWGWWEIRLEYTRFSFTPISWGCPFALSALAATINMVWGGLDDPLFGCYSRSCFTS